MKRRDLEKRLKELGWKFLRHGGNHDIWSNASGTAQEPIPRHNEVNEKLAKKIVKTAEKNKG